MSHNPQERREGRGKHRRSSDWHRTSALVAAGSVPVMMAFAGAGLASAATGPETPAAQQQPTGDRHGAGTRTAPKAGPLAAVDPGKLHAPRPVAPVKPIQAPTGQVRIGEVQAPTPQWLPPQQTKQVNDAAAQAEAQVATFGESVGLDPSRADRVAETTVGDAAVGAAIATGTVGAPLAAAGALVGGVAGLVAGVPFLPAGLVVGPPVGAAIGAAVTAAPFTALGAGVGAGVGAARGLAEPPHR
ncbi:hypothetical protein [Gordonia soli]|uniref:Uncharacterized protein n=1 Tax=Gordonia soli NBRC 108243 TaxID=1223545 RepID=M0QD46_9ACTN|nr:hypothetical protein [Gordonia soli]GAC66485.1 hypothetical protein GS4_02_01960 [Gordonia soli NBRC 108243]